MNVCNLFKICCFLLRFLKVNISDKLGPFAGKDYDLNKGDLCATFSLLLAPITIDLCNIDS